MRRFILAFVAAAALVSGGQTRCCKADLTSYESWARMTLTITGVRTEPSGEQLDDKPQDLCMQGQASVYDPWAEATGSGSASAVPSTAVFTCDPLDMQLLDHIELFTSVSGQAGPGPGSSLAYSWTDGSIYLMNLSESEDYYVDFRLDWEYSVSGPADVTLLAASFFDDLFYRSVRDDGLPLQDSGSENLQLCVQACSFDQLLIAADTEAEVTVAPVPLPGALLLGSLGMVFAGWRLRRAR